MAQNCGSRIVDMVGFGLARHTDRKLLTAGCGWKTKDGGPDFRQFEPIVKLAAATWGTQACGI